MKNNLVTCFKNNDAIKNFYDFISDQSEIKKLPFFGFFIIFQNMMTSSILISTSENNTTLSICKLGCITGIENNTSQMVKIKESENSHTRRKLTQSLKIVAFLENFFLPETPFMKVEKVIKISGSWLLWLKSYYNLNPVAGQKVPPA